MIIGDRLRLLREAKKLSQGDIEKRTGLLRCYISRVESGYTVPAIENLEKLAHALEVPLYRFFYEGQESPKLMKFPTPEPEAVSAWDCSGEYPAYFNKLRRMLGRIDERHRDLVLQAARKMAARGKRNGR